MSYLPLMLLLIVLLLFHHLSSTARSVAGETAVVVGVACTMDEPETKTETKNKNKAKERIDTSMHEKKYCSYLLLLLVLMPVLLVNDSLLSPRNALPE